MTGVLWYCENKARLKILPKPPIELGRGFFPARRSAFVLLNNGNASIVMQFSVDTHLAHQVGYIA